MRLLFSGLLALTLTFSLAACDTYSDDGYASPGSSGSTQTPPGSPSSEGGDADGGYLTTDPVTASSRVSGRPLTATLTGEAEVGPGDLDGSGSALVRLNSGLEQVCFDIEVEDIDAPTRIHIHEAPAGVNGPVVVTFFDLVVNPDAEVPADLEGCVSADRELVKEIRKTPSDYYVNVHTAEFPAGALRGQLSK